LVDIALKIQRILHGLLHFLVLPIIHETLMGYNNRSAIEDFKKNLSPFFRKHNIIKAVVFGSYARNTENRKSDLDLILVQRTEKRFFDRYNDILDIYEYLRGVQTDILIYTPEELERISSRPFIRNALEEGVTIYGD